MWSYKKGLNTCSSHSKKVVDLENEGDHLSGGCAGSLWESHP